MNDTNLIRAELRRLQEGDPTAADRLIEYAYQRMHRMAGRMLKSFPSVRRWEQTDDIWLVTAMSFHRALTQSPPVSMVHFFNLAGVQIRRTLIDLARRYDGPLGLNTNHDTRFGEPYQYGFRQALNADESADDPISLAEWEEFHLDIEALPEESREIFDLLWYVGLSQVEAADVLGIHYRSLKRRWRKARLQLYERRSGAPLPI